MESLHRFWVTFKGTKQFSPLTLGCGVTAYDHADALSILESAVFAGEPMLEINSIVEDVDIQVLDQNHVLPNMGLVTNRGVWFPLGY